MTKARKKFSKILACGMTAAMVLSASIPFFADASDKTEDSNIIYNDGGADSTNPNFFDYTNLITKTYGDRGYIDSDEGNFVGLYNQEPKKQKCADRLRQDGS